MDIGWRLCGGDKSRSMVSRRLGVVFHIANKHNILLCCGFSKTDILFKRIIQREDMTTNAACLNDCAATDSRWTIEVKGKGGNVLGNIILDNTGFEKIELCNKKALLFAGSAPLINDWKKYFFKEINDQPPICLGEEMSAAWAVIDFSGGIISSRHHTAISDDASYYFIGTGGGFAYECWKDNRCIITSVNTAKSKDTASGGENRFIKRNLENNLRPYGSGVFQEFSLRVSKEVAMFRSLDGKVYHISDANLDKETRTAVNDALKAENMVAHFDGMGAPFSQEEQEYAESAAKKALDMIWSDR